MELISRELSSPTLSLPGITLSSAGSYDVVITGSCGSVTSNAALLTVAEMPQITLQPVDQEICEGSDVSFSVAATGTNLTYQWRRNGTILPGKTTPLLSLNRCYCLHNQAIMMCLFMVNVTH